MAEEREVLSVPVNLGSIARASVPSASGPGGAEALGELSVQVG